MQFVLRGFSQVLGARIFAFEGIGDDRTRVGFTVKVELALARRYGIPLQELPLLCRGVLEKGPSGGPQRAFAFTEEDMRSFMEGVAERSRVAKVRKTARRPPSDNLGSAWRGPQR